MLSVVFMLTKVVAFLLTFNVIGQIINFNVLNELGLVFAIIFATEAVVLSLYSTLKFFNLKYSILVQEKKLKNKTIS